MDFQNVNSFNVWLNLVSGNLLPIINRDLSFSFFWKIYSVFIWIIESIMLILILVGCMYVSVEKALTDGLMCFVETIEMFFTIWRIHAGKHLVHQLIQKLNKILCTADETMKNTVTATLKPIKVPFIFYWFSGVISITMGHFLYIAMIREKNFFIYEDYRIPAIFSKQPFSFRVFLLGGLFILISIVYMFIKKVGANVYTVHLVLMITAQYRYIALKIAMIFQEEDENDESQTRHFPELYLKKKREIRALCQHHNDVIYLTSLLKELLSLSFSLLYVINVFRFCFMGILFSSVARTTFGEAIPIIMYTSGSVVQLYILCSSVQQLLDASMEITDKAFHENWYLLRPSLKRIFILMIMANNLECKIATLRNFNFSLPSFMTILNQSYSIALLFLKMK